MNRNLITVLLVVSWVLLFSTTAFATPIEPILSYDGNIKQLSVEELNNRLAALPNDYPEVSEESWPPTTDDSIGDLETKEYTFEDLNSPYLVVKSGSKTLIYYIAGLSSATVVTDQGISYYATVPDASIMYLLGPALIALGIVGRRKKRE